MGKIAEKPLTIAIPKGRLFEQVQEYLKDRGYNVTFEKRKLITQDESGKIEIYLVKNSDLPTYITHGIAGIGICGEDVLEEYGTTFNMLKKLPFGGTRLSLCAPKGYVRDKNESTMTIATSYTKMVSNYFHKKGISVNIIKLKGSVELAPALKLAPYIADLVETGNTLKANGLEVIEDIKQIDVQMIANPSYYKLNYNRINKFLSSLLLKD